MEKQFSFNFGNVVILLIFNDVPTTHKTSVQGKRFQAEDLTIFFFYTCNPFQGIN